VSDIGEQYFVATSDTYCVLFDYPDDRPEELAELRQFFETHRPIASFVPMSYWLQNVVFVGDPVCNRPPALRDPAVRVYVIGPDQPLARSPDDRPTTR
jgi:hypothetical protein